MYYIIYETKNIINEKIYVGFHTTNNLDDGYIGSGKILFKAIEKYGKKNFKRAILFFFNDFDEMTDKEAEIVNEEFIARKDTYNIKIGGSGGFDYINSNNLAGTKHLPAEKRREFALRGAKKTREIILLKNENYYIELTVIGRKAIEDNFEAVNQKRKDTYKRINHQQGNQNSQFGTCWIYSIIEQKSIKIEKEELETWINKGWIQGRKMKF